jgi:hypothetical protein
MPPPVESLPDFVAGDLAVHFQNQDVSVAGQSVKLTPVEYKLLYHLVRNAGHLLSHQALLDRVWGPEYDAGPEYLKVFISRLRAKLADRERRSTSGPNATEAIALSARLTHWPKTVSRVSSWRVPAAADAPPGRVGNTTRRRAPRDDHRVGHDHPTGYGRSVQATASSAQNSCTCLEVRR